MSAPSQPTLAGLPERPLVSIAVPMLDELGEIEACLEGFAVQTYGADGLDVMVIDGGSTDGSREWVERYAERHPWVRLVDNPGRSAACAFNVGLREARGEALALFSAHGVPSPEYVERSVDALHRTGAAGVGGRYLHRGTDPTANAIGLAMTSPFGMASTHRMAREVREVDTISHPVYRRDAMLATGWFDEGLARNSDYEFNHRMREAGFRLVLDPSIESVYRPRGSLEALARQFWWYGRWKARVVRRHPGSLRLRHLVAPAACAGALLSPVALALRPGRPVVAAAAAAYGAGVLLATRHARPAEHDADPRVVAAGFPVMHAAWGAGFLLSVVSDAVTRRSEVRRS